MTENEHYDIAVRKGENGYEAVLRLNIGGIKHIQNTVLLKNNKACLLIKSGNFGYSFSVKIDSEEIDLGFGDSKYLSSEVAEGFTGVVIALYSIKGKGEFENFSCIYE